jgi:glutathione synthase/RimK-type ligase-like ATP-grasp enzyme
VLARPKDMLRYYDRHTLAEMIVAAHLNTDHQYIATSKHDIPKLPLGCQYPIVVKTGNDHQGVGKFKCDTWDDIPKFTGMATVESFYDGESARVLFIGQDAYWIPYKNPDSWIKNHIGGQGFPAKIDEAPADVVAHAAKVRDFMGLEINGIDYVIEPNGKFHFLEANMYPGWGDGWPTWLLESYRTLFGKKMTEIMERAS